METIHRKTSWKAQVSMGRRWSLWSGQNKYRIALNWRILSRKPRLYHSCSVIEEERKKWSPTVISYLMVILLFKVTTLQFHIIDLTYKTVFVWKAFNKLRKNVKRQCLGRTWCVFTILRTMICASLSAFPSVLVQTLFQAEKPKWSCRCIRSASSSVSSVEFHNIYVIYIYIYIYIYIFLLKV